MIFFSSFSFDEKLSTYVSPMVSAYHTYSFTTIFLQIHAKANEFQVPKVALIRRKRNKLIIKSIYPYTEICTMLKD